jgi:hypothetical protein
MSIQDDIRGIFDSYDRYNFEPVECLHRCEAQLIEACAPGKMCDPRVLESAQDACNAYGFASTLFLESNLPSAATSILINGWNFLSSIQAAEGERIYRAGLAMYLAKAYLRMKDKGAATRWALLTQADDLLGEHQGGGGAGRQLLLSALGVTQAGLDQLARIANENLAEVKAGGWRIRHAYPEDLVTKFAFRTPDHAQVFATPTFEFEYPLNAAYLTALISAGNEEGISDQEKGRRFEDVATYLFILLPGLVPRRNVLEEDRGFETDIVVRDLTPNSTVVSELLGRHFLVECKSWAVPVGVADVGYFLYRIRITHARFGVLFARHGITGNEHQQTAAHSLLRKAFHEDGTVCIVIEQDAIDSLANGEESAWAMILERIERLRFGKPR